MIIKLWCCLWVEIMMFCFDICNTYLWWISLLLKFLFFFNCITCFYLINFFKLKKILSGGDGNAQRWLALANTCQVTIAFHVPITSAYSARLCWSHAMCVPSAHGIGSCIAVAAVPPIVNRKVRFWHF